MDAPHHRAAVQSGTVEYLSRLESRDACEPGPAPVSSHVELKLCAIARLTRDKLKAPQANNKYKPQAGSFPDEAAFLGHAGHSGIVRRFSPCAPWPKTVRLRRS